MTETLPIRRLLAAEARPGSATRRRMLLSLVGFAAALAFADTRVPPLPVATAGTPGTVAPAAIPSQARTVGSAQGDSSSAAGQNYALLHDAAARRLERE